MPQKTIQSLLRETFAVPDNEVWKRFASQELEGKNPDDVLSWNTPDHIRFSAYYDAADENQKNVSKKFRTTVADDAYFGPAKWLNAPIVTVTSEIIANEAALQHLSNGADGIFFTGNEKINLDYLIDGIDWRYCSLFFAFDKEQNFANQLKSYISKNNLSEISGGLFWETIPNFNTLENLAGVGLKNIVTIKSSTPVQEIADALTLGVRFIEESNNQSIESLKRIGFSLNANNSFLETIAKFKAIRFLWLQVAHAYGHTDFQMNDLHLHARSEKWIDEKFQPHGNLLKSTLASMAAVIGGADALTIEAEDPAHPMMNRIARNVSNLLREESHFDKVSDPAAGAYAIDAITDEFAKRAWKLFQQNQTK